MRGVALGGFMGVGKSTVGPLLAQRLGLPFVDLDDEIVSRAGESISDIFANHGESAFRALESDAIRASCQSPPHVLSLGGGALHQPGNLALLRDAFDVVVLTAPLATIRARVEGSGSLSRPLWSELAPRYHARQPGYIAAGPNIPTQGAAPSVVADRVIVVLSS